MWEEFQRPLKPHHPQANSNKETPYKRGDVGRASIIARVQSHTREPTLTQHTCACAHTKTNIAGFSLLIFNLVCAFILIGEISIQLLFMGYHGFG